VNLPPLALNDPDLSNAPFAVTAPPAARGVEIEIEIPLIDPVIVVLPLQKAFTPPSVTLFPVSANAEPAVRTSMKMEARSV
jgi:hypothetical protein